MIRRNKCGYNIKFVTNNANYLPLKESTLINRLREAKVQFITKEVIDQEIITIASNELGTNLHCKGIFYDAKFRKFFYGLMVDDLINQLLIKK